MSMTQEKMYMNVDDVCAVLGVSKAFAYKIEYYDAAEPPVRSS